MKKILLLALVAVGISSAAMAYVPVPQINTKATECRMQPVFDLKDVLSKIFKH